MPAVLARTLAASGNCCANQRPRLTAWARSSCQASATDPLIRPASGRSLSSFTVPSAPRVTEAPARPVARSSPSGAPPITRESPGLRREILSPYTAGTKSSVMVWNVHAFCRPLIRSIT
jgi:hypothetical protein